MVKKSAPSRLQVHARKIRIMHTANFGLFLRKSASIFAMGNFFHGQENSENSRDQSALLGEHLSQNLPLPPPYIPFFGQKRPFYGTKIP